MQILACHENNAPRHWLREYVQKIASKRHYLRKAIY